jgi:hypothetical protein
MCALGSRFSGCRTYAALIVLPPHTTYACPRIAFSISVLPYPYLLCDGLAPPAHKHSTPTRSTFYAQENIFHYDQHRCLRRAKSDLENGIILSDPHYEPKNAVTERLMSNRAQKITHTFQLLMTHKTKHRFFQLLDEQRHG